MIEGVFDDAGRPKIKVVLSFPQFGILETMPFLLDTGADVTVINREDAEAIGIPYDLLERDSRNTAIGVGGQAYFYREDAAAVILTQTGFVAYDIFVRIEAGEGLPYSVLGRNIINQWHIEYDPQVGKLRCTPHSADYELP